MGLRETLAEIRSRQTGGGSRAVLVRVIQPLLTELGWDVGDPFQVDLDHEGVDVVLSIPRGEHTSLADQRPGRPGVYVRFLPSEREFAAQAAAEQVAAVIRSDALGSPAAAASEPRSVAEPTPQPSPSPPRTNPPSRRPIISAPAKPIRKRGGSTAGKRIVGFRLWGESHRTRMAKELWLGVAEAIYERHPHDFDRALELQGRTRRYIARSPETLFSAEQIGDSPYFAEINFSSRDCMGQARALLELFGYRADELEVIEE